MEWLCEKNQSVEESPLEDDILQMKSELDRKHQELKEREESSEDPSTVEYVDDLFPCNTEDEEFELGITFNNLYITGDTIILSFSCYPEPKSEDEPCY